MVSVRLLASLLLVAPSAIAAPCAWPAESILTSYDCPRQCGTAPCVLVSPGERATCDSSACIKDLAGASAESCERTSLCVDGVLSGNKWSLDLSKVPAKTIQNLSYPDNVAAVEITNGDLKSFQLDESVLATPDSVTEITVSGLDLSSTLKHATHNWKHAAFVNAQLHNLPSSMVNLNFTSLNLSANPLSSIPKPIFSYPSLQTLSLRACNLTNVHVDSSQLSFLNRLHLLEAEFTATTCNAGSTPVKIDVPGSSGEVCLEVPVVEISVAAGSSKTVVAVSVTGGIVVLIVLVGCILCCCFRSRRTQKDTYEGHDYMPQQSPAPRSRPGREQARPYIGRDDFQDGFAVDLNTYGSSSIWNDQGLLRHRVDTTDLLLTRELSKSNVSEVWLGTWKDKAVAVKRLNTSSKIVELAVNLADSVKTYGGLEHSNIVSIFGVSWVRAMDIHVVMEYVDGGDLRSVLDSDSALLMTWAEFKCQVAIDIAEALAFLHSTRRTVSAGGLTSRNVLLDSSGTAKLGLLQVSRGTTLAVCDGPSMKWIAPEVLVDEGANSPAADVYAFGVILSELDTTKEPYDGLTNPNGSKTEPMAIAVQVAKGNLKPTVSSECPDRIAELANECLSFEPEKRPSAMRIAYTLRAILKEEL